MKKTITMLIVLAMLLALCACSGKVGTAEQTQPAPAATDAAAAEPAGEKTAETEPAAAAAPESLTIGTEQNLGSFLEGGDGANCYIGQGMIYNKIIGFDGAAQEYVSDILTGWEYEDDCTLVLHVRDGVTFANGGTLDAEDVLYTLKGFIDRSSNISGQLALVDFENSFVQDDMTVVLKTLEPYGPLLDALNVYVYDKQWVEENTWSGDVWTYSPNGSGPYVLDEYVAGAYAVFTLREDYWGFDGDFTAQDLPKTVTLKYYGEASTMYIDLEMGALDVASGITAEDLGRAADNDKISTAVIPNGDVRWFAMNLSYNEYLADEAVRMAIVHAIDWESIGIAFMGGKYLPADSIISTASKFYEPIGTYEYDPELSRQLLADAGYADGEISLVYAGLQSGAGYAEMVQGYLAEVGINCELEIEDFNSTIVKWLSPDGTDLNCQISATGVPTGEPWISLQQLDPDYGAFPGVTIADEGMLELLRAAVYSIDNEVRQENYTEFAQYIYDHALAVPTYQAAGVVAWRNEVVSDVTFNMYRLAWPQNMIWA